MGELDTTDSPWVCPVCGEPLGDKRDEGECSRCGSYIVLHRQTGEPVVVKEKQQTPAQRRSIFWPVVGALLFVFVVLPIVAFVGCSACAVKTVTSTDQEIQQAKDEVLEQADAVIGENPGASWVKVITLTGTSSKNSPVFDLQGGEQRIDWSVKAGPEGMVGFSGGLKSVDPDTFEYEVIGPALEPMRDQTYPALPPGRYQLELFGMSPWRVTVYEKR